MLLAAAGPRLLAGDAALGAEVRDTGTFAEACPLFRDGASGSFGSGEEPLGGGKAAWKTEPAAGFSLCPEVAGASVDERPAPR